MKLTPGTNVYELTETYPFLVDHLAQVSPKFQALKSPVLRKTLGRMASLGKAARIADMPVEDLLRDLAREIEARTGEKVEVDLSSHPATPEQRREALKKIIQDLHAGAPVEELKARFAELIAGVDPTEISRMEQELVQEGMPETEITRLCDLHVQIFQDPLQDKGVPSTPPGHPVHTFMEENRVLRKKLEELSRLLEGLDGSNLSSRKEELARLLDDLDAFDVHYQRKEYQLFPFLEDHGITAPPKVLWAVHDQIRAHRKAFRRAMEKGDLEALLAEGRELVRKAGDMIFKEEHILFPMALQALGEEEWGRMRRGEEEIGYVFVRPGSEWTPPGGEALPPGQGDAPGGTLSLDTGTLTPEQVNLIFSHLPLEVSFTDEEHRVRFYSRGEERIFPRSPAIIGRKVENCHPPKSLPVVQKILAAFEKGEKDSAEFWIRFQGKLVHIRYFAVRDSQGRFRGTLEVVQDVTEIQKLEGERRLLQWEDRED